ncbi:gamma-glutamyl peptidase 5-like protein [Cinnamomum micranthum f. kanehirae]|uniref:Gamma-glutamyl peptidase 5-like protein n=1 Tax=Cinnamomum micranthum f. kanehirae TaxID=337451 RepID=A0A443NZP6_9MAGN|nr:gamma-glutamyl peptidase 5-like protein [Cinnamomum micranthum f. kanehirae]
MGSLFGDFPEDEELEEYQGFVITGSCNDAHGSDPWVCKLVTLVKKLDSMHKKLLGFCFGHQVWELRRRAEGDGLLEEDRDRHV